MDIGDGIDKRDETGSIICSGFEDVYWCPMMFNDVWVYLRISEEI